jgi:hypothetical protein
MLRDAHGEITCHINHPFIGSPISTYPCARPRTAGNICPHAATTNDNPAGASGTDTEVKKCLAGLFYRRLGRRERDGEKPECLLGIRTVTTRQGKMGQNETRFEEGHRRSEDYAVPQHRYMR